MLTKVSRFAKILVLNSFPNLPLLELFIFEIANYTEANKPLPSFRSDPIVRDQFTIETHCRTNTVLCFLTLPPIEISHIYFLHISNILMQS